jgi:HSP20 family protein
MSLDSFKESVGSLWDNLAEGWKHLTESAAGALTRFKPGEATGLPPKQDIDDPFYMPSRSWAMLGSDVFEDETRLVVRLEIPGMEKQDFSIEVRDDVLVVSGEKRFLGEDGTDSVGRWRIMQCAYGNFTRSVPLEVAVLADQASATYTNGVLRIQFPKTTPAAPQLVRVQVD